MKFILIAMISCTAPSLAAPADSTELGTVAAWSNWFPIERQEEVDGEKVCAGVLADFQLVNSQRPYIGELAEESPVGFKSGTNVDGRTYFALSCRIRVYKQLRKSLLSSMNRSAI